MNSAWITSIWSFFDVETILVEIFGYQMSYLEFFGTLLNGLAVYLVAKKNILTWPIGLVAVVLFGILFYQIRLYADVFEQCYYFGANLYGWWFWTRQGLRKRSVNLTFSSKPQVVIWLIVVAIGSIVGGILLEGLPIWLPQFVTEPASYPWIDSFTTVGSFVAMLLMARGKIECWIYWLIIDLVGVWLYATKGVYFVAVLYGAFLWLAILGLKEWLSSKSELLRV